VHVCVCVELRSSAAEPAAEATVADDDLDEDGNVPLDDDDDDDDDEYGFDPKLHVWHQLENPAITEDRPDGICTAQNSCIDSDISTSALLAFLQTHINSELTFD